MTKELLALVTQWGFGTVLTVAALFGFFPKFVVNLIVLVYPPDHPRRRELPAELEAVPLRERLTWVFGQCATVLFDGVPARVRDLRSRIRPAAGPDAPESPEPATPPLSPEEARRASFLARAAEVTMGGAVFGPPIAPTTPPDRRLHTTRVSGGRFAGAYVFGAADPMRPLLDEAARRRNNRDAADLAERLKAFYEA
ncbi:hypothetical protein H4696_003547 [Amycolatopsis lexingtonensis]|uniref:Uncharacterized protein n=1 Tax=Amycolatopsis lexingtonensis TaxID=218822 RepID=A0ABR9I0K0_9PSEU|nr:hypothetical protein [Amycolatopsis lexingtonensis]MBE1496447.1 hypothetical protein [Amycolatopsis lexingtonensis]